jgi:hypothetical protein
VKGEEEKKEVRAIESAATGWLVQTTNVPNTKEKDSTEILIALTPDRRRR